MNIAIIGAGSVGQALGTAFARVGHTVTFGVRRPDSVESKALPGAAVSMQDAVDAAGVVVVALPWPATQGVLEGLTGWEGKILLDATNPIKEGLAGLEEGPSGGEKVAGWAKGARVVKVFNTTGNNNMIDTAYAQGKPVMFYAGDDAEAKRTAGELVSAIGFEAVDAGPLKNAALLESAAMLWVWLAVFGKQGRNFAYALLRR